ncbi:tetratricopeptide repeat protein [Spirulina sp. CCNP1310]|nr:tetratricopeptide repeat protein [Spirulina sp. CCNP1310]
MALTWGMAIAPAQSQSLVIVSEKRGNVEIQRGGGTFQPLAPGARLQGTDLIRVASGGSVTLLCGNLATQPINRPGTFSVVQHCPMAAQAKSRQTDRVRSPQDSENPAIPYLLNPRNDGVMQSLTPTIRWHDVPGVTEYTVYLQGRGLPTQSYQVRGNTWVYDQETPLQYGRSYRVTIVALGTACDRPGATSPCQANFMLLTEAEVAEAEAKVAALTALDLPPAIYNLSLAEMYGEYELYGEGIAVLEKAIAADTAVLSTYITLAEFYEAVSRYQTAQTTYEQAWAMAQETEDGLAAAAIAATLGELHDFLGDQGEAIAWLERAEAAYTQLGDQESAAEIAATLAELRSP